MSAPLIQNMTPRARGIWLEAYELGAAEGWRRGYGAAEADLAALQRQAHAVVQQAARGIPYAQLCERRGEHARAQRQRQILQDRKVMA